MGRKRKTRRDSDVSGPRYDSKDTDQSDDRFCQRTLQNSQECQFVGCAWLEVLSGELDVDGRLIGGKHKAKQLLTSEYHLGGPLCISVPLGSTHATFTLSSLEDPSSGDKGFQLLDQEDIKSDYGTSTWNDVAKSIIEGSEEQSQPVYVVAGSKNLGKSTFAKSLVNNLLNKYQRIAYLDTDLGQPEFTVPGLVSLSILGSPVFGPAFLHQRKPEYSYFLGDVSPESDPFKAMHAVTQLCKFWHEEAGRNVSEAGDGSSQTLPLIVNTNGWIQGVGLEYLKGILSVTVPTDLILLKSTNLRRNLPETFFWLKEGDFVKKPVRIHTVQGLNPTSQQVPSSPGSQGKGPVQQKTWAAADLRNLAWLSFANRCIGQNQTLSSMNTPLFDICSAKLAEQRPFVISFRDIEIQVLHARLEESHLAILLNCAIVGLARKSDNKEGLHPCIGIGFVRAIDSQKGLVYLLSDLSQEALEEVDLLQIGKLSLPQGLLQTQRFSCPYLSFWSISQTGSGAGTLKSRNNLKRGSQHPNM